LAGGRERAAIGACEDGEDDGGRVGGRRGAERRGDERRACWLVNGRDVREEIRAASHPWRAWRN
jgi:hypothetical protein